MTATETEANPAAGAAAAEAPGPGSAEAPSSADAAPSGPTRGDPAVDFNDVFSLRKPKDAKAGLSSGLKSITKGVAAGVVGLVAGPVIGAKQEGLLGFGKGLAAGMVGAVVLPVTGVTVGAVQMVRGVVNTPEAIAESSKGKIWDEERRQWMDKPDGAIITLEDAKASAPRGARAIIKPAPGVDYYEVLQVPRNAPPEAIKKAYYVLARKWHPDKNPGDASAHEKFQLLGQAYQVLSNAELRARYDSHGSEGLDVNFMDGGEFFNMLFGSDLFEHWVGELAIAQAARSGGEMTHAQMKAAQNVRMEKLVINLKATLERFVVGDEEGFKLAMQQEAQQLATASFGDTMLHAIGRVYAQQADIHLGGIFGSLAAKMKASTENMKSQINAASAAIKVYQAHQKIEQLQRDMERKAQVEASTVAAATAASGAAAAVQAATPGGVSPTAAAPTGAAAAADGDKTPEPWGAEDTETAAKKTVLEQEMNMARQAMEEAALPLMLEAMWAANVLDIQNALRKVCKRLLQEQGVPPATLKSRAQALRELGAIFQAAKAPERTANASEGGGGKDRAGGAVSGAGGAEAGPKEPSSAGTSTAGAGMAAAGAGAGGAQRDAAKEARRQMEEAMYKVMEKRAGGGGGGPSAP